VDLDALQELADNLSAIYDSLDHAKDDFSTAEGVLGSSDVAGSLHDFSNGWKDGRETIKNEIASLMDAVKGAAEDYLHNENQIKDASTSAGVTTTQTGNGPR
jgi:hypothetical protein